jgi:type VI secretion system secreted protein Hcp
MKRKILLSTLAALLLTTYGWGQVDYYLKIDQIPGESTERGFEHWIACVSFTDGISGPKAIGLNQTPEGPPTLQDIVVTKYVDIATTSLNLACAKGIVLRNVVLACARGGTGREVYTQLKITLDDVVVKSVSAKGGLTNLTEDVVLSYRKIRWEYIPLFPNGRTGTPVSTGWNLDANVPW